MNIKSYLTAIAAGCHLEAEPLQLPDSDINPAAVRVLMISEAPPPNPDDGFYSPTPQPDYLRSTLGLFEQAGVAAASMRDLSALGIYITTAVKSPKTAYAVATETIKAHLPLLEAELALFPNLKVIMLMGDVAKKAVNMLAKARSKKNIIPSEPTYKIRGNEYFWGPIRVFPSYIITGGNLTIEKSKRDMIADDICRMMEIIKG